VIPPTRWVPVAGYTLEPNALVAATELQRNLVIVAGPGAGKTEMLAQRADFLLRTNSCPYPRRILAISFKTDAASNLRDRVAERCGRELAARLDSHTFHAFAKRIIDRFRVVLTGIDALDVDYEVGAQRVERRQITFADMVPLATEILATSAVARNALRNTYSHVFLDEFQDCTNRQYTLVRAAFDSTPAVMTAVGDTKQRIMGWAGALDGIFEQFANDFEADVLHLYQNFRSALSVRRVQNAMVKVMDPPAAVPDADLIGDDGVVVVADYFDCAEEAAVLAEQIGVWVDADGLPASEIAVLVRQEPHLFARRLIAELEARGIAYRNEQQLQDDFSEPLGQLLLDFLAVSIYDRQPDAYRRLQGLLAPGSGDDEIDRQHAARWRRYLQQARSAIRKIADNSHAGDGLVSVLQEFVAEVGPERLAALSPEYATGARLEQLLASLLTRLGDLADGTGGTLSELTQVTDDGAVRILTIHKAKGLEFHTVVVMGVEAETFWSNDDAANRAEFFVAISRAKQRLILTVARQRERPPGAKRWDGSRTPHPEFLGYALLP
jgi:superfamily I DNA/RNA helicase